MELPYKDEKGRIFNTHLFSEVANHYLKTGRFTDLPPKSYAWNKFWEEQVDRCLNGYTLGSVRITGYMYFFLNFYRMEIAVDIPGQATDFRFPKFWKIHYDFFNILEYCQKKGLNLSLIKPRSAGFSEIIASIGVRDFFLSDNFYDKLKKRNKTIHYLASADEYVEDTMKKASAAIYFLIDNSGGFFTPGLAINSSKEEMMAGYRTKDNKIVQTGGYLKATTIDKPDKVRGKRGHMIFYDEAGAFQDLSKCVLTSIPLTLRAGVKTGTIVIGGTSNEKNEGIEGFRKILYSPSAYSCIKFKNVWAGIDLNSEKIHDIPTNPLDFIVEDPLSDGVGWFIPVYMSDTKFFDKDGNPDYIAAYNYYMQERKIKLNGLSDTDFNIYKGDHPFTMEEALYKKGSNIFDQTKIAIQYQNLIQFNKIPVKKGYLEYIYKDSFTREIAGVEFIESSGGNIIIAEEPVLDSTGVVPTNLYIAGLDSIDMGDMESTAGSSKVAMLIKKRPYGMQEGRYVAMYLDRPKNLDTAFDNLLKLSIYYNLIINLEFTRTNVISFFKAKKQHIRFCKRPEIAVSDGLGKNKSNLIGTQASPKLIGHQDNLIANYVNDSFDLLPFIPLVEQLRDYTREQRKKYDLIVAMGLCELLDEDYDISNKIVKTNVKKEVETLRFGYYTDEKGIKRYGELPKPKNNTFHEQKVIESYDFTDPKNPKINYYQ